MIKIINKDMPLRREEVSREGAQEDRGPQRAVQARDPRRHRVEPITIYHIGDEWWDLCAGPHVESTKAIHPKAIDLESVAGAYWRAASARCSSASTARLEHARGAQGVQRLQGRGARRDHRKVGKDLNLFSIQQEDVGGGLVFWHPKGAS